ncbi:MAG: DUF6165 family protein [Candidatus Nanoarchaeia archaeon]|nr:DUF6165 family protein [Candidatus Nanoarchaeia archaeon]
MEILVPISIGELYDKITILEIKIDHIKDPEKLQNIQKELNILIEIFHNLENIYVMKFDELKKINQDLWDVEDQLRIMERNKEYVIPINVKISFSGLFAKSIDFIELARRVYYLNDKRAEIKKEINILYNSNIIEEKSYERY